MTLYHGTSANRWAGIQRDGVLRRALYGDQHVSLTDCPKVAKYFADLAADCDSCAPVVLTVDADGLPTEPFQSGAWGDGECEWERETACLADVPVTRCTMAESTISPGEAKRVTAELRQHSQGQASNAGLAGMLADMLDRGDARLVRGDMAIDTPA